jgi:hypothetical protein
MEYFMENDNKEIIDIWHPVNGKWLRISQVIKEHEIEYYTDGKMIATREVNKDGTIKSL